jgi:hypothetical protein
MQGLTMLKKSYDDGQFIGITFLLQVNKPLLKHLESLSERVLAIIKIKDGAVEQGRREQLKTSN